MANVTFHVDGLMSTTVYDFRLYAESRVFLSPSTPRQYTPENAGAETAPSLHKKNFAQTRLDSRLESIRSTRSLYSKLARMGSNRHAHMQYMLCGSVVWKRDTLE